MSTSVLGVGDRVRRRAGFAIVGALAVVAVFTLVTVAAKETPALYEHQPWQDDPYDALVSADFVWLPLLVISAALRVQLCRRYRPLPVRRVVDLLRISGVAVAVSLVTQFGEWIALVHGDHRSDWNPGTFAQAGALAALTLATGAAGVLVWQCRRELTRTSQAEAGPDWLADTVALGFEVARRLGPLGKLAQAAVAWADRHVICRVRAHPIATAAFVAAVLALPEVAAKILLEGYPALLALFVFMISTASLFAFLVVAGSHIRVVAPGPTTSPIWIGATVVGCIGGTLAVAFRDALPLPTPEGPSSAQTGAALLIGLLLGAGVLAGVMSLPALVTFRRIRQ